MNVSNQSDDAEPTWNVLGLKVARKTEIIALVAFILSLSGVVWQVYTYTRGAVMRIFPTDQVVFTSTGKLNRAYSGEDNLLLVVATMSYVNDGEIGQNGVIRRESISITGRSFDVVDRWYQFGSSDVEGGKLPFERKTEASPFPVAAASGLSHETLFAPWEIDCSGQPASCNSSRNFLKWPDFIAAIKADHNIHVTINADVYPSKRISASCDVKLRDWEISNLEKNQALAATCTENDGSGEPAQVRASQKNVPSGN